MTSGLRTGVVDQLLERHVAGLYSVAVSLTDAARLRSRKNTDVGSRRQAITQTRRRRDVLWGISVSLAPHSVRLELGFKPHWVPERYLGDWARRNSVPLRGRPGNRGLLVGGPNSRLQTGLSGTSSMFFAGRGLRVRRAYRTRGGKTNFLPDNLVGSPILKPAVALDLPKFQVEAFQRGFNRGRR